MKNKHAAIVTGSNGSIGKAICNALREQGLFVLGIDIHDNSSHQHCTDYIKVDLEKLASDNMYAEISLVEMTKKISGLSLLALINNAAVQITGTIQSLSLESFRKTMDVNLIAPWYLTKLLFEALEAGKGWVINIGSIHSMLTKPKFVAYATSKGGLASLTRALSVDIGSTIKCCLIEPAAIQTEMLMSGFNGNSNRISELKKHHPSETIGSPEDIASVVRFVLSSESQFLNGLSIPVSGGIMNRLHDPE